MKTAEIKEKKALSLEEVVDLNAKGVSAAQLARMEGVSRQAISKRLKDSGLLPAEISQFTKDRSLILRGKQKLILSAITPEKVKTMSVRDAAVAAAILIDKQRLLDGESTANIHNFTEIDLSMVAFRPAPVSTDYCSSCNTHASNVVDGFCELCRTDNTGRRAEAAHALPAPGGVSE